MSHYWFTPASVMMLLVTLASVGVGEEVTIMAVGDSITQGGKSFHCYREFLIPMLSNGDNDVRFVGPNQDQFSAHCGHGGKNTQFLNSIIRDVYAKHPADIVLIHSGHNGFNKDKPVPKIIEATYPK